MFLIELSWEKGIFVNYGKVMVDRTARVGDPERKGGILN